MGGPSSRAMHLAHKKFDIRRPQQALKDTIVTQEPIIFRSSTKADHNLHAVLCLPNAILKKLFNKKRKKNIKSYQSDYYTRK